MSVGLAILYYLLGMVLYYILVKQIKRNDAASRERLGYPEDVEEQDRMVRWKYGLSIYPPLLRIQKSVQKLKKTRPDVFRALDAIAYILYPLSIVSGIFWLVAQVAWTLGEVSSRRRGG